MNRKHRPMQKPAQRSSSVVSAKFVEALRHHQAGELTEAERLYRQILAADPRHANSLHLLGMVAYQTGNHLRAVELINKAILIDGTVSLYYCNLGNALKQLGRLDEAVMSYHRAIDLMPDFMEAHYNLGNTLAAQGRLPEAVICYRAALSLKPDYPQAHNNLGRALHDQGLLVEATACCRRATELKPDLAEAHNNLGAVLERQGYTNHAVTCYRTALGLTPEQADTHNNLAFALLAQGDMVEGWQQHEWRWKTKHLRMAHRDFGHPQWRGEPAAGQTLLIHAEQGFGDTLQFCRYASLAAARGLRVIMEVQAPLVRLLSGLSGVDLVLRRGDELPPFDLQCSMLSLPLALGTTLTTIPAAVPYLHADGAQSALWRTRLAATTGQRPRIGLVWAGSARRHLAALHPDGYGWARNPYVAADGRRSMAPERLEPLFDVPGLCFFALQKDGPTPPQDFPLTDHMAEMEDFADTAALIANLDLVISVDTAVAHLAAALGKPVWLLNRFNSCWRWLADRRDSPWYPTLRLYRQPQPGDWGSVLAEVTRDLHRLAAPDGRFFHGSGIAALEPAR